jgi:two-component system cell cycle response regulator
LKAKASGYLPVLMVSTRNSVNARVEGLRSGADDYLGKPYDREELRARVEVLLRTRAAFDERGEGASAATPEPARVVRQRGDAAADAGGVRAGRALQRPAGVPAHRGGRGGGPGGAELTGTLRAVIEAHVRKIDLVMRSDERGFLLVLPNTHFPGALTVAERISRETRKPQRGRASARLHGVDRGVVLPQQGHREPAGHARPGDAALERARREQGGKICLFQHQGYLYAPED